jgi:hypothetical protein
MKEPFSYLVDAQLSAMLGSILVFILVARWYIIPKLKTIRPVTAIVVLLWVHVPRYFTLIQFSAQQQGYPISHAAVMEAVVGDVAGTIIALMAILAFRRYAKLGIVLSWLLVAETVADVTVGVIRKAHEPLWGKANGVTWLILDLYIPFILVCLPLLIWFLFKWHRNQVSATNPQ